MPRSSPSSNAGNHRDGVDFSAFASVVATLITSSTGLGVVADNCQYEPGREMDPNRQYAVWSRLEVFTLLVLFTNILARVGRR